MLNQKIYYQDGIHLSKHGLKPETVFMVQNNGGIGEISQIMSSFDLTNHLKKWDNEKLTKKPIGFILSLEGADSIISEKT